LLCGANIRDAEGITGQTIGQVRDTFQEELNISPEAETIAGGEKVTDDHVVQPGQQYEFVKPAGTNG